MKFLFSVADAIVFYAFPLSLQTNDNSLSSASIISRTSSNSKHAASLFPDKKTADNLIDSSVRTLNTLSCILLIWPGRTMPFKRLITTRSGE